MTHKENRPPMYIEYLDYREGERKPHPEKVGYGSVLLLGVFMAFAIAGAVIGVWL